MSQTKDKSDGFEVMDKFLEGTETTLALVRLYFKTECAVKNDDTVDTILKKKLKQEAIISFTEWLMNLLVQARESLDSEIRKTVNELKSELKELHNNDE